MSLQTKIEARLSEALKSKDKETYSTLRLVVAAIKDAIIAKKIKDKNTLPDADLTSLLKKMVKQRNDSCEAYKKEFGDKQFFTVGKTDDEKQYMIAVTSDKIVGEYYLYDVEKNNIILVVEKKNILIGIKSLDITSEILNMINEETKKNNLLNEN